jgi:hypothetical protein
MAWLAPLLPPNRPGGFPAYAGPGIVLSGVSVVAMNQLHESPRRRRGHDGYTTIELSR